MESDDKMKQRLEELKAALKKKTKKLQVISRIKKSKEHVRTKLQEHAQQLSDEIDQTETFANIPEQPTRQKEHKLSVSFMLDAETNDSGRSNDGCLSPIPQSSNGTAQDQENSEGMEGDDDDHELPEVSAGEHWESTVTYASVDDPNVNLPVISESDTKSHVPNEEAVDELDERNIIPGTQFIVTSHKKPLFRVLKSDSKVEPCADDLIVRNKVEDVAEKTNSKGPSECLVQNDIKLNTLSSENSLVEDVKTNSSQLPVLSSESMESMSEWQVGSEECNETLEVTNSTKSEKRRTRKSFSSEVMDFSFLEEENGADMYSGIKSRRRSTRRSRAQESGSQEPSTDSSLSGSNRNSQGTYPSDISTSKSRSQKKKSGRKGHSRSLTTERLHTALAILVSYATSAVEQKDFNLPHDQYGGLIQDKCSRIDDSEFACASGSQTAKQNDNEEVDNTESSPFTSQSSSQEPIPSSQASPHRLVAARKVLVGTRSVHLHPNKNLTSVCPASGESCNEDAAPGDIQTFVTSTQKEKAENPSSHEVCCDSNLKSCDVTKLDNASDEMDDCSEFLVNSDYDPEKELKESRNEAEKMSITTEQRSSEPSEMRNDLKMPVKEPPGQPGEAGDVVLSGNVTVTGAFNHEHDELEVDGATGSGKGQSYARLCHINDIKLKDGNFVDVGQCSIKVGGIRRDGFIVATEHQLHFWITAEDPLSFICSFTWSFPQMTVLAIKCLPCDSEVSLVVKALSSVGTQVFHLSFTDPDAKNFIHILSCDRWDVDVQISPISQAAFVVLRSGQCFYYEVDTAQKNVKKMIAFEKTSDSLLSVHPVEGLPCAVLGVTSSAIYVWNCTNGLLVSSLELPGKAVPSKCLHASSEKGVLALLMSLDELEGFVMSCVICNPMSGRSVAIPLWKCQQRIRLVNSEKKMLLCTTTDGKLQLLSMLDGKVISETSIDPSVKTLRLLQGGKIIVCFADHCAILALT